MKSLINQLSKRTKDYLKKNDQITDVVMFGSFMRGKSEPNDIDILIIFKDKIDKDIEYGLKNTLLKIAAKEAGNDQLAKNPVNGPIAALFAYEDEFAPLKELFKYAKTVGFPAIKLSYINSLEYDAEKTMAIAKLPDLKTLQAQFVYTLNANLTKLAYVLSQIKK